MAHALRAAQAADGVVAGPPAAPVLSAAATPASVELSWTEPDDGGSAITGYDVQRRAPGGTWEDLAADLTQPDHVDTDVLPGETWHYQVRATNAEGDGAWSNEAVATVPLGPEAPGAPVLSATPTPTSVDLSWAAPGNGGSTITGYDVQRRSPGGGWFDLATGLAGLGYSDTDVSPGETWHYQVRAVNDIGPGPWSNEAIATVPEPSEAPSAPSLSATRGDRQVRLDWTAPADDGGADVTNYQVWRRTGTAAAALVATVGDVLTYTNTGLTNGTTYWYTVVAVNSVGPGAPSNEVSATPATRPSAPRSLKAQKVFGGIQLTWQVPTSNGGSPITAYRIYRTGGPATVTVTVPASQLSYLDMGTVRNTWYAYVVSATNAVGESQASNIVLIKAQ
jgi:titin